MVTTADIRKILGDRNTPLSATQIAELRAILDDGSRPVRTSPVLPDMRLIPDGDVLYGEEKKRITVPAFDLAETPTTVRQWRHFLEKSGYTWTPHVEQSDLDEPIVGVTYHDAVAYCEWLSKITGDTYQLPTEIEWERAARGDDGRIYPWGNTPPTDELANCWPNHKTRTSVYEHAAGASPFGILDMSGNVWEWTRSPWKA